MSDPTAYRTTLAKADSDAAAVIAGLESAIAYITSKHLKKGANSHASAEATTDPDQIKTFLLDALNLVFNPNRSFKVIWPAQKISPQASAPSDEGLQRCTVLKNAVLAGLERRSTHDAAKIHDMLEEMFEYSFELERARMPDAARDAVVMPGGDFEERWWKVAAALETGLLEALNRSKDFRLGKAEVMVDLMEMPGKEMEEKAS
ncbi:MAG: hypothetical protein LQ341_005404 [Variospora aurantia]|nr:MAG: hypothetical protein LQ341_005404 [Variospora aurantia]